MCMAWHRHSFSTRVQLMKGPEFWTNGFLNLNDRSDKMWWEVSATHHICVFRNALSSPTPFSSQPDLWNRGIGPFYMHGGNYTCQIVFAPNMLLAVCSIAKLCTATVLQYQPMRTPQQICFQRTHRRHPGCTCRQSFR